MRLGRGARALGAGAGLASLGVRPESEVPRGARARGLLAHGAIVPSDARAFRSDRLNSFPGPLRPLCRLCDYTRAIALRGVPQHFEDEDGELPPTSRIALLVPDPLDLPTLQMTTP